MTRSMTAFSRYSLSSDLGLITFEIQSLNRKHLEVQTLLPREFQELDAQIKKRVHQYLSRGQVQVFLSFTAHQDALGVKKIPNIALAKQIEAGWMEIAQAVGLKDPQRGLEQLLVRDHQLFQTQVESGFCEKVAPSIFKALDHALNDLCQMREKEGVYLKEELEKRALQIEKQLKEIEKLHAQKAEEIHKKLKGRLEKFLEDKTLEDERMLKEVAFLSDKADVSEEILRIQSHLNQFAQTLSNTRRAKGKMLDFISQELTREWNTIASKCQDAQMTNCVLVAKSECEKIREQIHNIE